jgi:hypothetical protein
MHVGPLQDNYSLRSSFGPGCLELDQPEMATDHEELLGWRLYFNPSAKSMRATDLNLLGSWRLLRAVGRKGRLGHFYNRRGINPRRST